MWDLPLTRSMLIEIVVMCTNPNVDFQYDVLLIFTNCVFLVCVFRTGLKQKLGSLRRSLSSISCVTEDWMCLLVPISTLCLAEMEVSGLNHVCMRLGIWILLVILIEQCFYNLVLSWQMSHHDHDFCRMVEIKFYMCACSVH